MHRHIVVPALATLSLLMACGGRDAEPTAPPVILMRIVAGANVKDTVQAKLLQPLTVEVTHNGHPRSGVQLRLEAVRAKPADPKEPGVTAGVFMSTDGGTYFGDFVSDTTDQNGRVSVLVQLGWVSGVTGVQINAPQLGLSETAVFEVLPGNASKLIMAVRDTVVRAGGSFGIGAYGADRFSNPQTRDEVTYAAVDTLGMVSATGTVQAGSSVGRSAVVVRAGALEDSAHYTVVPNVALTAVYEAPVGVRNIVTLNMDGTNVRVVGPATQGAFPTHSRTGGLIAYNQQMPGGMGIKLVDSAGSARVLVDPSGTWWSGSYPRFSGDGASIYFGANTYSAAGIWRMNLDGSGVTELAATDGYWMPAAVSPDESRIAYVRSSGMVVQTLGTGDTVRIGASGWFPSFSPDGQWVAYADESSAYLRVVKANGSASTLITEASLNLAPVVWMPDGRWILAWGGGPELVNPTSREVIRLPHLSKYSEINLNP